MKKYLFIIVTLLTAMACQKDNLQTQSTVALIQIDKPQNLKNAQLSHIKLAAREANTGLTTLLDVSPEGLLTQKLPFGSYTFSLEATISYEVGEEKVQGKAKSYVENVLVKPETSPTVCKFFLINEKANFVIKELFYTGNTTPEGKSYNGDKYFLIYNNSDSVLYADGLLISQSKFLTSAQNMYTPDVMNEAFTTSQIVMIPGDGDDYPIQPGAQFVVANNAINHLEYNANSLDLSTAEFEIDLIASINVDNPLVPNTIGVTGSLLMNNQGLQSYVIAKLPKDVSVDQYLKDNFYTYSWKNALGNTQTSTGYKLPNDYIIDAVNVGIQQNYQWLVTAPSIDMGYTYTSVINADLNRFGKSVIRKVLSTSATGKDILQDTNNSAADFIPQAKPSLYK